MCGYVDRLKATEGSPVRGDPERAASVARECRALVALAQTTGYASWTKRDGWLDHPDPHAVSWRELPGAGGTALHCRWHGVHCTAEHLVQEVYLMDNGLDGTLPGAIGNLGRLGSLYLDNNALRGPLPDSMSRLASLENLQISGNRLSGALPRWLGDMPALKDVYLGQNELTGPLFSTAKLRSLRELVLHHNKLSGVIPADVGVGHPELEHISLSHNQLRGPIPDLSALPALQYLHLESNQLSGLDESLCKLPAALFDEQECYIANNAFGCEDYPKCLLGKCDGGTCARNEL